MSLPGVEEAGATRQGEGMVVPTKEPMFLVVAEQLRPMARCQFKGEAVIATGKSCA